MSTNESISIRILRPAISGSDDGGIVTRIKAICGEFGGYGCRRTPFELGHRDLAVNVKKVATSCVNTASSRSAAAVLSRRPTAIATCRSSQSATGLTVLGHAQLWGADIRRLHARSDSSGLRAS